MRWGVRDEATDDHMTTSICLEEVRNCQQVETISGLGGAVSVSTSETEDRGFESRKGERGQIIF
jgi:hypothetical protein